MNWVKISIFLLLVLFISPAKASAFWIWTPESGKWTNPKYAIKPTPREQLEYLKEFFDAGKYPMVIAECKKLLKVYPRAKEAPEAQYYIGKSLEEQGKLYEAFKAYQLVIDKYPFSERAAEIVEIQFNIGNQLLDGRSKKGRWVEVLVGNSDRVIEVFRMVIKNAPYGKFAAISQYKIGLYLKEKGLFQESRDEFEKAANDYPTSEWAKAAKFQIALADASRSSNAQYEQKVTQVALDEFNEFVKNHPDSELSPQAKKQILKLRNKEAENVYVIAQFYEKQKNFKSAKVYYSEIIDRYNDTPFSPKALERLKMIEVN